MHNNYYLLKSTNYVFILWYKGLLEVIISTRSTRYISYLYLYTLLGGFSLIITSDLAYVD